MECVILIHANCHLHLVQTYKLSGRSSMLFFRHELKEEYYHYFYLCLFNIVFAVYKLCSWRLLNVNSSAPHDRHFGARMITLKVYTAAASLADYGSNPAVCWAPEEATECQGQKLINSVFPERFLNLLRWSLSNLFPKAPMAPAFQYSWRKGRI